MLCQGLDSESRAPRVLESVTRPEGRGERDNLRCSYINNRMAAVNICFAIYEKNILIEEINKLNSEVKV
jgi:hypothetical protein